jgi:hypothetical protein
MAIKRLNAVEIPSATNTQIYSSPTDIVTFFNLAIINRNTNEISASFAITDDTDTPATNDWFEYFSVISKEGVLERTQLALAPLQRIIAISPSSNLSAQVWGEQIDITVVTEASNSGRLGKALLVADTTTLIYQMPSTRWAKVSFAIANKNSQTVRIHMALTSGGAPTTKDWFEYYSKVPPYGVLERENIFVNEGQKLYAYSDTSNVIAQVWGIGNQY